MSSLAYLFIFFCGKIKQDEKDTLGNTTIVKAEIQSSNSFSQFISSISLILSNFQH